MYLPYLRPQHAPHFPKGYVLDTQQMPDGPQHARGQLLSPPAWEPVLAKGRRDAQQLKLAWLEFSMGLHQPGVTPEDMQRPAK